MHAVLSVLFVVRHLYNVKYSIYYPLLSKALINKRKLIIITYLTNSWWILWCNIIWYYSHDTVYSAHLQCIQCIPCIQFIQLSVLTCIQLSEYQTDHTGLRLAVTMYKYHLTETHVSHLACRNTCSNSKYNVHVFNNSFLHASNLVGRYIYD